MSVETGPAPEADIRVLVVEDTESMAALIRHSLEAHGFSVDVAPTLHEAREQLIDRPPDIVLLDVDLPDGSGFQLLREAGGSRGAPVVILTSHGAEEDRVLGLELGAEDYVLKPFFPRELAMRLRRAVTRQHGTDRPTVAYGDLVIDLTAREVTVRGEQIRLTRREFDLLAHLAAAPRRVFSREQLLREVWRSSPDWQTTATITEHIRRLRRKLEIDPLHPRWIVTSGTSGYRFEPDEAAKGASS